MKEILWVLASTIMFWLFSTIFLWTAENSAGDCHTLFEAFGRQLEFLSQLSLY